MREHRIGLGGGGASKLMAKAPSLLPRGLARVFALALLGVILSLGVAVPKAAANPLDSIGAAVMQLLGMGDAEPADAFDKQKTVDPSTIATWSDIIQNDTENIGRIWTTRQYRPRACSCRHLPMALPRASISAIPISS